VGKNLRELSPPKYSPQIMALDVSSQPQLLSLEATAQAGLLHSVQSISSRAVLT
jgi:hypothetical protein